jgi:two-component system, NtrC family, nitrogen regulation sensor histidine kinase NtrY
MLKDRLKDFIHSLKGRNVWVISFAVAFLLFTVNYALSRHSDFSAFTASRLERIINKRVGILETYMAEAMSESQSEWLEFRNLPEDMVIYRYLGDSLQSWCNQFSVDNDDISKRLVVQRFANLRYNFVSPLAEADTTFKYLNMGSKWYLVKSVSDRRGCRVIGGLEVRNSMDNRSVNGVNPRLRLPDRFTLNPISATGGVAITVAGQPLMKLIQDTVRSVSPFRDSTIIWLSIAFFALGILLFLKFNRSLRMMFLSAGAVTVLMAGFYFAGYGMQESSTLFSPILYADGPVLYSLGALLIINIWIVLVCGCLFLCRSEVLEYVAGKGTGASAVFITSVLLMAALLLWYVTISFKSLIFNSNIPLELYKIALLEEHTLYVYLSYLILLSVIPLLLQIIRYPAYHCLHIKYDVFSRWGRILFSVLCALYLLSLFSILGARKEANRVEIWTNRLAIDRDLGLELQLRGVENAIVSDNAISDVIRSVQDYRVVLNRITETYMSRISKDYDVSAMLVNDNVSDPRLLQYLRERVDGAVPIAPGSSFVYSRTGNGRAQYTGMFVYYYPDRGVMRLLIGVNSKADKEDRGYSFILNANSPGTVVIPPQYSYAKYMNGKLVSYKGDYPYPTVISGELVRNHTGNDSGRVNAGKYVHYITHISDEESIVLSRRKIADLHYVVAGGMIFLLAYFWISLLGLRKKRNGAFERNYYKSRVNTVLFMSMLLTLMTISVIMVFFVYKRNDANIMKLMTSKISTIQSLMENRTRIFQSYRDLATPEMNTVLSDVAEYTSTDLTLYSPGGKVFNSTVPEIFEKMILGSRTNQEAYRNIMYSNKRYYIHKERVGGYSFYTMYAPIINDKGTILAIISAPYTDSGLAFKADAAFHSAFVIIAFFILLIITRFFTTRVVDKMFRPIIEMGRKMLAARTGGLEYIIYDKEDEISGLVRAYNLMVHDLSESGKQVAQAERERAWSEMARQVAHEIKNPLTPMKLQIQRLIRLKGRNDPSWETKFDDISRVILDSIDVLTDTANEFSTFAKLYSEEMVPIDLDAIASDQISMFDDKDNITFQYFGLKDAWVTGPKPQMVRVFVNLLTNAVQAIENQQVEDGEQGLEPKHGQIILSLRNSSKDGYYDIVFEDNGPGIKDENRSRLFTPNFTTKSSGTGLGLAICKNILERCGGEIFYSRSFTLKGACFTVRYPKNLK